MKSFQIIGEVKEIRKLGKIESKTYFDGYVIWQDMGYGIYSKMKDDFEIAHPIISRILSRIGVI